MSGLAPGPILASHLWQCLAAEGPSRRPLPLHLDHVHLELLLTLALGMRMTGHGILLSGRRVDPQHLLLAGLLLHLFRCLSNLCLLLGQPVLGHHHGDGEVVLQVPL